MKSTSLAAALFVTAALGASASFAVVVTHSERDLGWEPPQASSSLTREAVRADYLAARKSGTLPASGERSFKSEFPGADSHQMAKTRAEVKMELKAAKKPMYSDNRGV